jgi:hypothetical protein
MKGRLHASFYPEGNSPRYPIVTKIGWKKIGSGRCGEGKISFPRRKSNPSCPARCPKPYRLSYPVCLLNCYWASPAQCFLVPSPMGLDHILLSDVSGRLLNTLSYPGSSHHFKYIIVILIIHSEIRLHCTRVLFLQFLAHLFSIAKYQHGYHRVSIYVHTPYY